MHRSIDQSHLYLGARAHNEEIAKRLDGTIRLVRIVPRKPNREGKIDDRDHRGKNIYGAIY